MIRDEQGRDAKTLLLVHGVREFAEYGFAGARVDRIAQRAGVNKQLIYYYFGGKTGLYEAIHVWTTDNLDPIWDEVEHAGPRELLQTLFEGLNEHTSAWRALVGWEGSDRAMNPSSTAYGEDLRAKGWLRQTAIIERAQERGELRDDVDPRLISFVFTLLANGPYMLPHITRMMTGREADSPELAEEMTHFFDILMAGLRPPPAD